MDECFKCGITGDKVRLFDAIGKEGIIKICDECASNEDMPMIKTTTFQFKEESRRQTVYERLSRAAGLHEKIPEKNTLLKKQETTLREIVDRNYKKNFPDELKPRPDLIDNFHWVIMTARRRKKISQAQLANEIAESETTIKMAERGVLPKSDYNLINKLENYLGIELIREGKKKIIKEEGPRKINLDFKNPDNLTIADLHEMRKKREEGFLIEDETDRVEKNLDVNKKIEGSEPGFINKSGKLKKSLSDERLRDLIFKR